MEKIEQNYQFQPLGIYKRIMDDIAEFIGKEKLHDEMTLLIIKISSRDS